MASSVKLSVRHPSTPTVEEDLRCDASANLMTALGTAIAGERNPDSATNSYLAVYSPANLSIISKTTAVTIGAGAANDTHLLSVIVHTALTGTLAITGFADSDAAAQTYTIPAAFVGTLDFKGAINSAGALTMTASNAADDNKIAVLWRAI